MAAAPATSTERERTENFILMEVPPQQRVEKYSTETVRLLYGTSKEKIYILRMPGANPNHPINSRDQPLDLSGTGGRKSFWELGSTDELDATGVSWKSKPREVKRERSGDSAKRKLYYHYEYIFFLL